MRCFEEILYLLIIGQCWYAACFQVEHGAQVIFGPSDPQLGAHVQSICDALEIPHLEARLDMDYEYKPFSINVYPPIEMINQAFMDVMFFLNWTKVAIIYEEDQGDGPLLNTTYLK